MRVTNAEMRVTDRENQKIEFFKMKTISKMKKMKNDKNPSISANLSRPFGVCHAKSRVEKNARDRVSSIKRLGKRDSVTQSREEGSLAHVLLSEEEERNNRYRALGF
jgi:hypothetical protein